MAIQGSGDAGTQPADDIRSRLQARLGDAVRILDLLRTDGSEYLVRASVPSRDEEVLLRIATVDPVADPAHLASFQSFERRAESLARLDHPNIVAAGRLTQLGNTAFYAVRDARANTLENLLAHHEHFSLQQSLEILRDVAAALDYASAGGVVHGQLDPSVIVLGTNGITRVADFAAGSDNLVSHSGRWPAYRAPELWQQGARPDARADIYALGVIAFEMLSGRRRAISVSAHGVAIVDALPLVQDMAIRPGIGLHVNGALLRAVSKRPSARFATASEFIALLEGRSLEPLHGLPTRHPDVASERSLPFALLPMLVVIALGVTLGVLAAGRIPQSLLQSEELRPILNRLNLRPNASPLPGYASSGNTISSSPAAGGSPASGSASSSGPIFPGAATAAGSENTGGRASVVTTPPPVPSITPPSSGVASAPSSGASAVDAQNSSTGASAPAPSDSTAPGYIRVEYDGPRTLVLIDGLPRGRTPLVGRTSPGPHSVRLVDSRAQFPVQQIRVSAADTALASFFAPASP